jgi:hypothetical protein
MEVHARCGLGLVYLCRANIGREDRYAKSQQIPCIDPSQSS